MDQVASPIRPAKRLSTFAFYWRVAVKRHPKEATTLLVLMLGGAVLDTVTVGLTVPLLDVLTDQGPAGHSRAVAVVKALLQSIGITPSPNVVIFTLLALVSMFFVTRSALFLWNQYWTAAIAVKLRWSMKVSLFEKFLHARYEEIAKRSRGTIVHDINTPAESLASSIMTLGAFCTGVFNSILMIALLLYLSWWSTLLLGVLALAGVQGWRWYADRRAAAHGRTLYGLRGEQNKLQVDAIDGLKVVKAHGLERRMIEQQDTLLATELRPELQLVLFRNGPMLVNEVIAIVVVLALGAITFLFPALGIRFSMLAAFLLAMRRIAPAMASINQASVTLNRFKRDLEMIEEVTEAIPQEPRGGALVDRVAEVRLDGVSFAYASRPNYRVLKGITAVCGRGTVTALVGPTGAGKSTIAHLLLRLYEPLAGSVLINELDLRRIDLHAWRKQIGYVSQDVFVFNASIKDNIALGDERVSSSRVEWAARVAQLHEFVTLLPNGYDTVVGDRGLRLSGGQCQRLAIARAILRQPQVLIFDEATSALDNLTERAVYDAISAVHRDAIVIVIAHRLSTVRDADQILVLQGGRLVERGTHQALIGQRGVYAGLYEEDRQASEKASAEAQPVVDHV